MSRIGKIMRKPTGGLILRNPTSDKIVRFEGPGAQVRVVCTFATTATGEEAVPATNEPFVISKIDPTNPFSNYRGYYGYISSEGWFESTAMPSAFNPLEPCHFVLTVHFEPNAKHVYDTPQDWRVYLKAQWSVYYHTPDRFCLFADSNELTVDRDKESTWVGNYAKNQTASYSSPGGSWGPGLSIAVQDEEPE